MPSQETMAMEAETVARFSTADEIERRIGYPLSKGRGKHKGTYERSKRAMEGIAARNIWIDARKREKLLFFTGR